MFEETDSVLNIEPVPSNVSYKSFKTQNLPMQNSYCDHRNFDSVDQSLYTGPSGKHFGYRVSFSCIQSKPNISITKTRLYSQDDVHFGKVSWNCLRNRSDTTWFTCCSFPSSWISLVKKTFLFSIFISSGRAKISAFGTPGAGCTVCPPKKYPLQKFILLLLSTGFYATGN